MQFITEKVSYFRQTSPLIEPLIMNGVEKLFNKYAYRIMPLILSDGEIIKNATDVVNFFDDINNKKISSDNFLAVSGFSKI
jgi:hypothetical protein